MKIAFVRKKFVLHGGAERHAADFINQLAHEGHEVHVFAAEWKETPGIIFHKVPVFPFSSFFKTLSFAIFANRELRKFQFDIIQSNERTLAQDIYRAGDGCHREWLLERRRYQSGIKNIFTILNPFHRLMLAIEQKIFTKGRFTRIIAISKQGKKEIMRHYGVDAKDIQVIYNGVDLALFSPASNSEERGLKRKQWGIGENDFLLLFVGSGFERKGLRFLLLALGEVKKQLSADEFKSLKLLVCGKGKQRAFHPLITSLGIQGHVIFTGVVADREHYYKASDLFVFPTIYEPFGNVHLEALACALPVITTSKSGASELIQNGANGFVVEEPSDVRQIAQKIIFCLQNPDAAKSMGQAARKTAEEFPLERNAREVIALYEDVLRER